jgi:hypothetical protein
MAEETGVKRAIREAGGKQQLADGLGITYQAVAKFERQGWLPLERAKATEGMYGIPLKDLVRPDIAAVMTA